MYDAEMLHLGISLGNMQLASSYIVGLVPQDPTLISTNQPGELVRGHDGSMLIL